MGEPAYAQSWLDLEQSLGGRLTLKGSEQEIRTMNDQLLEMLIPLLPKPSDAVESKDGEVDGVKYRLYTPTEAAKAGPLPVGIWTHGGGWMLGDLNTDDLLCRIVAEHAPSIIISVDYSLTPKAKVPTQLNESLSVYKWAQQNAASYGGDANKFYTIGGSAGGGLALQIANRITKKGQGSIHGVAAIVPVTMHYDNVPENLKSKYKAYEENGKDAAVIDGESMQIFYEHAGVDPKDSDIFTAYATDNHKNFPPTYFAVCERDPLRDDGIIMEELLKNAGVKTKLDFYEKFPHYFWIFPQIPEGQEFVGNMIGGVKWLISQM